MEDSKPDVRIGPEPPHAVYFTGRRPWSADSIRVHKPETKMPIVTTTKHPILGTLPTHIRISQPDKNAGGMPPFTRKTKRSKMEAKDHRIHPRMVERSRLPCVE